MNNYWNCKLTALFHDPPDKQLGRPGHEKRGGELLKIALGYDAEDALWQRAQQADKITSAADRQEMLRSIRVDIVTHPTLTHMLSGRRVTLPHVERANGDAQTSAVTTLVSSISDSKIKYLTLWRRLWEQIAREDQEGLGKGWALVPAETRQPDHSLVTHLDVTAALATALPNPAFLMLSTGSVQPFIEASRRTQDLWMGSYLLSYLVWRGIQAVIESVGPDAILYPSLRGHPLVDLWLKDQGVTLDKPPLEARQQASFPDSFTALVPAEHAQTLAQRAEAAIKQARDEIAQAVRQGFAGLQQDATWCEIWERQLRDWPAIYWSVYPWPLKDAVVGSPYEPADKGTSLDAAHAQIIVDTYKELTGAGNDWWDEFWGKRFDFYWQARRHNLNSGTTYVLLHDLARRGLAARKATRDFAQVAEPGEKCTVCGEREALHLRDGSRDGLRAYWGSVAKDLQKQGRYAVIRPEGAERLCALCAMKRFAQHDYFEVKLGLKRPFPSTRHIAAATFWCEVLQSEDDDLWQSLTVLNAALYASQIPKTTAEDAIPFLTSQLRKIQQQDRQRTAAQLLRYDAELLTPDAYQDRDTFFKDWGVDLEPQKLAELRRLSQVMLKTARKAGIMPPARYFAVLFFDGDEMGKWVSGELGPKLQDVLHPEAHRQIAALPESGWKGLLEQKRLVSPAHHAAITQALATFAQRLVRLAVEEWYPGRVVYAGGDDVLALLPVAEALQIARSLRFLFSGEVGRLTSHPGVEEILDDDGRASGFIALDGEWLATMGPTATASAGMVIAHYQAPLGDVLRAVREVEKEAKNSYGRNALAVRFLKRSGEPRHVGTKWFYEAFDPLATLIQAQRAFDRDRREQDNGISGKMPYTLRAEASTLSHLDREAIRVEIGRLLKRQSNLDATEQEKLARVLADWVKELNVYECKGAEMVADWLILARFLASGGGEE
ncbi:MAG TPA: type III-B CRISPR-associated protein Cas10/Cmr2 [Anaerolineae bacterium]|nr:type III-B CRISPR-associated protein Cas10/Cmr2 [Anaerolineae bacterium]